MSWQYLLSSLPNLIMIRSRKSFGNLGNLMVQGVSVDLNEAYVGVSSHIAAGVVGVFRTEQARCQTFTTVSRDTRFDSFQDP